jgi:hypothetical protein
MSSSEATLMSYIILFFPGAPVRLRQALTTPKGVYIGAQTKGVVVGLNQENKPQVKFINHPDLVVVCEESNLISLLAQEG